MSWISFSYEKEDPDDKAVRKHQKGKPPARGKHGNPSGGRLASAPGKVRTVYLHYFDSDGDKRKLKVRGTTADIEEKMGELKGYGFKHIQIHTWM